MMEDMAEQKHNDNNVDSVIYVIDVQNMMIPNMLLPSRMFFYLIYITEEVISHCNKLERDSKLVNTRKKCMKRYLL